MNKKTLLWAAVGVALVAGAAMAADPPPTYQSSAMTVTQEGVIYYHTDPRPLTEGAVALPTTAGGGTAKSGEGAASSKPGPTSFGSGDLPGRDGSAIVGPRGGGLYSPQQSADREVARLIKKLG